MYPTRGRLLSTTSLLPGSCPIEDPEEVELLDTVRTVTPVPDNRQRDRTVEALTGHTLETISVVAQHIDCHVSDVVVAAMLGHMGATYEQAAIIATAVGPEPRSRTSVQRIVAKVLTESSSVELANPSYRFSVHDHMFVRATCIIDGVPVYLARGDDAYYNGKKKRKYLSFQVAIALDGTPLWHSSAKRGRVHDSRGLEEGCIFEHGNGIRYFFQRPKGD